MTKSAAATATARVTTTSSDVLVVGQSHAMSLRAGAALLDESTPLRARFMIFERSRVRLIGSDGESAVEGDWGSKRVLDTLRGEAAQTRHVAILWAGSQFNIRALFVRACDFDLVIDDAPTLPGAQLLPVSGLEWLIRETLSAATLTSFCVAIRECCPGATAFLAPPPPSPDDAVMAGLSREQILVRLIEELPGDRPARLVDASVRAKLWRILRDAYSSYATQAGLTFVGPPAAALGPDGLLAREFASDDATHANAKYGALYLQRVLAVLGGSFA